MLNGKHGGEGQTLVAHEHRDERRRPIVARETLRTGRHATRVFDRGFAEKDKTRGIIRVRLAALLINPGAIEKLIAADKENLQILGRASLEEIGGQVLLP